MNATEIYALSQKQAKAVVNARQETSTTTLPEAEVKAQIQLQAQALVHTHTQAQNALNINMGVVSKAGATSKSGTAAKETTATTTTPEAMIKWQAEHYSTVTGVMAASKSSSQIASKPSTQRQKRYNQLLPQKFECSDLPREFFQRRGIYSCSNCDQFRLRNLGRKRLIVNRSDMSNRIKCQCNQMFGLLRFRILAGNNIGIASSVDCIKIEETVINPDSNVLVLNVVKADAKKQLRVEAKALEQKRKDEVAAQVRASLTKRKLEKDLAEQLICAKMQKKMKVVTGKCHKLKEALKLEKTTNFELKCKLIALEKQVFESSIQTVAVSTELSMEKVRSKNLEKSFEEESINVKCL
jgi:hypothetical protein